MGIGIKISFIFLLLSLFTRTLSAQMPADSVDLITYNLLMEGKWDEMMSLARKSIKSGSDFHYLRLRMGIYYYNKHNYRKAATHFLKAYKFYSSYDLTNEYLYYATLWGSRENDAYLYATRFSPELKNKIGFKKRYFDYLSSDFSYTFNNTSSASETLEKQQLLVNGYQTMLNNMYNFSAGMGHKISSRTYLVWSYYRLNKNDFLNTGYSGSYRFYNQYNLNQDHFYLSLNQYLGNGFALSLSGNYINTVVNGVQLSTGFGQGPGSGINATPDTSFNAISVSAGISKDFSLFNIAATSNYSTFSGGKQYTQTAYMTYYPFGNLNLYLTYSPSYHTRVERNSSNALIHSGLIGYKIFRYLWNEIYFSYGDIINYSNYYSYYIYNDINKVTYLGSVSFIIPLKKIKWIAKCSYTGHESIFHSVNFDLNNYNKIKYNTINVSGGFIWYF